MARRINDGQYLVGEKPVTGRGGLGRTTDHVELLAVRGDVVNQTPHGALARHYGVKSSKWYVFRKYEVLAKEYDEDGHLLTSGSSVVTIADMVNETFDTKTAAVDHIKTSLSPETTY
jgi:hypothetical protein